ncbi:MAG: two-component sensor histidine kinase [Desulfomonile tiedjei]|nr:two-component sensor histidine kinase [Desulfomonile tiedjei]
MTTRDLHAYLIPALILLSAVPVGLLAGVSIGLGVALLAGAWFFHAWSLSRKSHGVDQANRCIDEQVCRAREFATVDELSAGIAHEINNPLGIIAQEIEWIQHVLKSDSLKGLKDLDDCKDSLREIAQQVDRCKEIVHKLLSLAREAEPVIQCVDINHLIESMTDLVEREVSDKNIKIVRNLQPDLPAVYSDPPLLRQVILNLLVNASHAIEKDGIISITTVAENGAVEIVVRDTGCGIPNENLQRIFTPFFSTKPQGKGTGLGLAICRGIIERLGGYISATSDVGRSTAFTIHLPIQRCVQGET